MNRKLHALALVAFLGAAAVAPDARAQSVRGEFTVSPTAGWMMYDESSSLSDFGSVGLDISYFATDNIGVGLYFDASRPTVQGDYFPPARHVFPDTVFLYQVSQQVTQINYGVLARFEMPAGPVHATAMVGGGRFTVFNDPEAMRGSDDFSGNSLVVGGAIGIPVGDRTGIRIDARNYTMFSFDRERMNPVHPNYRDTTWPELRAGVPEAKETINNLRFSIGMVFVPGSR